MKCLKVTYFDCHDIFVMFPESAEQRPLESQRQLRDLSHLALARYHLVARPHDPTRLTRIFVVLNSVSTFRCGAGQGGATQITCVKSFLMTV